jgi:hypothetical protein
MCNAMVVVIGQRQILLSKKMSLSNRLSFIVLVFSLIFELDHRLLH